MALGGVWYVDDDAPNDPGPGDPLISDPNEDGSATHPFDAIQDAIDVAVDGDEVVLLDGTYTGDDNRDLDFHGRAVTVRSASGNPATCIIDCEGAGRGFYFHNGEGPGSIVQGLTVTRGRSTLGGGIHCDDSSPTLANCTIAGNSAEYDGGGVYCRESNVTVSSCTIIENSANQGGGGVYCDGGSPTLTNCAIGGNSAVYSGGGVLCNDGSPTMTNCAISGNVASFAGGGVICLGSPTLANCTISGNSVRLYGGGVYCADSSTMVTNCILWGNTPEQFYVYSGDDPVVTYCDIQDGMGESWFGVGCIDIDPLFAFADDLHLMSGSPCIDVGTNALPGGLPADDLDGSPRALDGDGDTLAIADMGAYEFNPAVPSIALSPTDFEFFARIGDDDPNVQTLMLRNAGGETLAWEINGEPAWLSVSPSTGASDGQVEEVILGVDISGLAAGMYRAVLEISDPQAVNSPRHIVVTLQIASANALHVPSEYPTIQAAIDAATLGDEIVIADGTYTGVGNKNLDFGGKAITVRSASGDPASCIVDCEGDGRGFRFHTGEGLDSVVNGLTITRGNGRGGGVYCSRSSPTLTDCRIIGNSGSNSGGGVMCDDASRPALTNCTISANSCTNWGGGVFCSNSAPTLINCTISENSSTYYQGGGVFCSSSNATLINCTISGNSANDHGGGVYCGGGIPILIDCAITGNTADYGGGVFCSTSAPFLINCRITANSVSSSGGGVMCSLYSGPTLTNCTICANSAEYGGGVVCSAASNPVLPTTLTNCTIGGNWARSFGGGIACYNSNTRLTNCIVWGSVPEEMYIGEEGDPTLAYCCILGGWSGEGNIDLDPLLTPDGHLTAESPCIDLGSDSALPQDWLDLDGDGDTTEPSPFDIDGDDRVLDAQVDMGADEFLDSDGDMLPGWWEQKYSGSPTGVDPWRDSDGDLLCAADEYRVYGSNPMGGAWYVSTSGDDAFDGTAPLHGGGDIGPKRTIQAALDIAASGDSVLVAAGTYSSAGNFGLDFHGQSIVVRAYEQPGPTVVDCGGAGRVIDPNSLGPGLSTLEGFVVRYGAADSGGAVLLSFCRLLLRNCTLEDNAATSSGGGFACSYALPGLHNMTLRNNAAPDGSAARMVSSHAYLADRLRVETGELLVESSWFTGPGELSLAYGTLMLVAQSADAPATVFRTDISGKGDIWIEEDAELRIEQGATVDLSGHTGSGCADPNQADQWGTITIEGALVVRDATIQNTNVDVKLADFEGHNDIVNNNISLLESSEGFGGEFWVEGNSLIRCNYIVSEGDRYLDLDPDPNVPEDQRPTLEYNTIHVLITQGAGGERGELLELRAQDYDCGGPHNPDCTSGAFQAIGSPGFTDDPSENWVLKTLEILPDCKLSLTNRQHFDFQLDPNHPETVYVHTLKLHPGAVLNTALQTLYYEDLVDENDQVLVRDPNDPHGLLANGSRIVDVPLLGFSLKVIPMEDDEEFRVRVRRRLRDPNDVQPDPTSSDPRRWRV